MKTKTGALIVLALLITLALPAAASANGVAGLWQAGSGEKIELQPDPQKVVVTIHFGGGQKARFGGWWTTPGQAFQFRAGDEGVISCTLDGGNPNVLHVQSRHGQETWQRMGSTPPPPPQPTAGGGLSGLWRASSGEKVELQPDPGKVVVTIHFGGGQKARFGGWWTTPGRAFQFRAGDEGVISCTLDGGNPNVLHVQSRHGQETWQRMGGN